MEFKYILSRKRPFSRFMHSLCKNENIPMWGKHIAAKQKKLLSTLPGSLFKFLCFPANYAYSMSRKRLLLFIVVDAITMSVLSFVSRFDCLLDSYC